MTSEINRFETWVTLAAPVWFAHASEGIMITDRAGVIRAVNPAFTAVTGYTADEIVGRRPRVLSSGRHDAWFYADLWASIHASGTWSGEIWNRRKNGELYLEHLSIIALRNEEGSTIGYTGVFTDLSVQRERQYDSLTGLLNRQAFMQRVDKALADHPREGARIVVMLDLDRFQQINDTMGHGVGDRLLQAVADRLRNELLPGDMVARVGGDEFGLLLTCARGEGEQAARVRKLQQLFRPPLVVDGHEYFCSVSIGASRYPEDGTDAEELMKKADAALYRAREQGGRTFRFFTEEINREVMERALLETGLHHAVQRGDILVYYQPKVDLGTGRLIGMEALARWRHPERGFISPAVFVPLAEENGLIDVIGEQVLTEACRQTAEWQQAGGPPLQVAVNLSASQLVQKRTAEVVSRVLAKTGLQPDCLELEITESAAMNPQGHVIETLHELKQLGVTLTIDDFGTGYSSLSYLTRFPIDGLKIDRSFVRDLGSTGEASAIVQAVLSMARSLGLTVVAEGVETREQEDLLKRWHCEYGQGYYYGEPLPAEEFQRRWIRRSWSAPSSC